MRDACTSSNSLLEFRLGSIRPSGLKDIMIQTLAEWHMKDRAKGLPPLFGTEPATIKARHPDHSATS